MIELGETVAATSAAAHGDDRVWLAARILLGRQLVSAIGQELLAMGGVILLAMLTVLSLLLRKPRAVLAVAIPPLAALTWSFGMLGYMGVALMPMHVLVATFVAGIGIDDAIFLGDGEQRSHALSPVLATTITSVAGVGAMALAGHPMVSAMGQSLLIGMTSCLIACLLFCPFLAPKADHQLS
jgi:predicted RND superfamily exporter protein